MATNGNLSHSREPERTESDATHFRLRDQHPVEYITCLSCGQTFPATSHLQIVEHYSEVRHLEYYADCLYCRGKVHRYNTSQKIEIYHNCFRWKRGLDK